MKTEGSFSWVNLEPVFRMGTFSFSSVFSWESEFIIVMMPSPCQSDR